MDPATILAVAATSVRLAKTAWDLGDALCTYTKEARVINTTLQRLIEQIKAVKELCDLLGPHLEAITEDLESRGQWIKTRYGKQLTSALRMMKDQLVRCEVTLESLRETTKGIRSENAGAAKKAWATFKFNSRQKDMHEARDQLALHLTTLNTALHIVDCNRTLLAIECPSDDLKKGLDALRAETAKLESQSPSALEDQSHKDLLTLARISAVDAETVYAQSIAGGSAYGDDTETSTDRRALITAWLNRQSLEGSHRAPSENGETDDHDAMDPAAPNDKLRTDKPEYGQDNASNSLLKPGLNLGVFEEASNSVPTGKLYYNKANLVQVGGPRTNAQASMGLRTSNLNHRQAAGVSSQRGLIGANTGINTRLFPKCTIQPASFYSVGRVFLALWAEPVENENAGTVVTYPPSGDILNLSWPVVSKERRFVVIRASHTHCSALLITSYSGRGVSKKGVVKSEHAIIYAGTSPPQARSFEQPTSGEAGMQPKAIRMVLDSAGVYLDPMSRINFAGIHMVNYNIKTKSLGVVSKRSLNALQSQFRSVWSDINSRSFNTAHGTQRTGRSSQVAAGGAGTAAGVAGSAHLASREANDSDEEEDEEEENDDDGGDDDDDDDEEETNDGSQDDDDDDDEEPSDRNQVKNDEGEKSGDESARKQVQH